MQGGRQRVKLGGLAIAIVGFLLTRFLVATVFVFDDSFVRFVVTGGIPLVVGLGLTVFGVGLAISTFSRATVNTIARWCLLGLAGMAGIAGFSALETGSMYALNEMSAPVIANILLGGAVAGTVIGVRSAQQRHQRRDLQRHVDRATLVNRVLRHEVLNAVTIVRGYAGLFREGVTGSGGTSTADAGDAIHEESVRIEHAISQVEFLNERAGDRVMGTVDLGSVLDTELEAIRDRYPDADVRVRGAIPADCSVVGTDRLGTTVGHLLENAIVHTEDGTPVWLSVTEDSAGVTVRIADDGDGMGRDQRTLLERGTLPEYDDPSAGFGLTVSRLLIDRMGGSITVGEADPDAKGTVLDVWLQRPSTADRTDPTGVRYGVTSTQLSIAAVAAIVAGITMGVALHALAGLLPVIGALYGVTNPIVGWTTHLFHSVIFGLLFAGAMAQGSLSRYSGRLGGSALVGVGYGIVLWLVAAGLIMPVWLSFVGVDAMLPNLTAASLFAHVVWGGTLGSLYALATNQFVG